MIGKCIKPWAWTANITGGRGYPLICSSHIDKLVLVEGSEREASRSSLSLFLGGIPRLKVTLECFRVLEGSPTHGADSHDRAYHRQV